MINKENLQKESTKLSGLSNIVVSNSNNINNDIDNIKDVNIEKNDESNIIFKNGKLYTKYTGRDAIKSRLSDLLTYTAIPVTIISRLVASGVSIDIYFDFFNKIVNLGAGTSLAIALPATILTGLGIMRGGTLRTFRGISKISKFVDEKFNKDKKKLDKQNEINNVNQRSLSLG